MTDVIQKEWSSKDLTYVASGTERKVFEPNFGGDFLIKIRHPFVVTKESTLRERLYGQFPRLRNRYIEREKFHSDYVNSRAKEMSLPCPIARILDIVSVDGEKGIAVEKITDSRGDLAPDLLTFSKKLNDDEVLVQLLNKFVKDLIALKVIAYDLFPNNILVINDIQTGLPRLILIDGFGDRKVIKIRTWFDYFRNRYLTKGLVQLARCLNLTWNTKDQRFEIPH